MAELVFADPSERDDLGAFVARAVRLEQQGVVRLRNRGTGRCRTSPAPTSRCPSNHPSDSLRHSVFTCAQAGVGKGGSEGYCNPAMDKLVQQADTQQIDKAVTLYQQAGQQMVTDAVDANLFYGTQTYITATYVKGTGFNSLYDYGWTGIRIIQH